ncbi:hypothetical protein PF005_g24567 [Phytophthora fragariae]|uniref:Uncharacterized protein n=1 Tax=Phytophthora fragariae TaxID=53985 RepID=A0A6A3W4U7_9STRA|nr:hypothetical protein PF003_g8979 [Phytophthora fragariae]KAE9106865.1 hypothetical protein PF010_g12473 [Phytophthora fragariae]KAE9177276.1 hypothetical protein PF005_g24567 [Phytophthora fragariae]KAE9185146.1 hypothetical protein PF004_g23449 [Phytophthora fragariae]KAE9281399.1 hypothetical protein PF001_g23793 [Phytophthora fragariae]
MPAVDAAEATSVTAEATSGTAEATDELKSGTGEKDGPFTSDAKSAR